jgi:hypothetical protein
MATASLSSLEMRAMTLGELFEVLESGNWQRLVGEAEDDQIDFKRAPYQLTEDRQKWNLATDVAAFANAADGAIVIGVATQRHPNEAVEAATEIHRVTKAAVNPDQYRDVIRAWIHPPPAGVRVRWFPPDAATPDGLFVIEIPPQADHLKPFLVRRTVNEQGISFDAVAVPRRDGDRNAWDSAEEIQRQLAERRSFIARPDPRPSRDEAQDEVAQADAALIEVLRLQEWTNEPVYILQAIPQGEMTAVQGLYREVRNALARPQVLRQNGFALRWRVNSELREAGVVIRHDEGATWVSRYGLTTEAHAVFDDSPLGWAFNQDRVAGRALVLNPIALVEITLEFFRFIDRELRPRRAANSWTHRILCLNFRLNRVILPAGRPRQGVIDLPVSEVASSDDRRFTFDDVGTPQRNAFRALTEVYALFGLEPAAIPFAEHDAISEQRLLEP